MSAFRAYGTPEPGKSAMFKVGDTPRTRRRVVSWSRGLHYPDPYKTRDGWRCGTCLGRLREYRAKGVKRLRHVDNSGGQHG